ncbi:hypothetical protein CHS0354_033853 [Potamilus streckersoni]|uniref:Neurotransmitter-gated ion-channel ligand-binding domain-containing protein n=1 Tax=Potamilus streckersoni TaxID=2493646 RepID=A0AAE0RWP5_9BIVA|nr:hypothetical protein CHS0354_033853 [Potamilus streckersoni]
MSEDFRDFESWYDQFLTWNKNEYGGLHEVLVSIDEVWTPDLLVENTYVSMRSMTTWLSLMNS